jgi:hypothetical protein
MYSNIKFNLRRKIAVEVSCSVRDERKVSLVKTVNGW